MDKAELKKSEVAVQDFAAKYYEEVRYTLPSARAHYDWFFKKLFSLYPPQGKILDNGCGVGILGQYLPEAQVTGVDISPEMVKRASQHERQVQVADSSALPFEEGSFDTVYSLSLLHHMPDPVKGMVEVARVLKPGGHAVFEEVVKTGLSAIPRYFLNSHSAHFSEEHKNFPKKYLLENLSKYFEIEKVTHYGYLAYALLGFPDVINFQKYLPFKKYLIPALLKLDDFLEKVPLLRTQSWNIIIVARKK